MRQVKIALKVESSDSVTNIMSYSNVLTHLGIFVI